MKWWALALLAVGCSEKTPGSKGATALRVPLPDGWVATGSTERLLAGPKGRPVVSFESKSEALPAAAELVGAAQTQKATSVQSLDGPGFVGARYALENQDAFVGVKTVGTRTVWCASLHGASEAEVVASLAVCREIELRGP